MGFGGYAYNGGFDRGKAVRIELERKHGRQSRKTVFATDEAIHVWAQQTQPYGRNAKGTVYFDGATIFSYGDHFPMGRFLDTEHEGKRVVLITSQKYSPTTSNHVSSAAWAVNHCFRIWCHDVTANDFRKHAENVAKMLAEADENEKKAARARKESSKHWHGTRAASARASADVYARVVMGIEEGAAAVAARLNAWTLDQQHDAAERRAVTARGEVSDLFKLAGISTVYRGERIQRLRQLLNDLATHIHSENTFASKHSRPARTEWTARDQRLVETLDRTSAVVLEASGFEVWSRCVDKYGAKMGEARALVQKAQAAWRAGEPSTLYTLRMDLFDLFGRDHDVAAVLGPLFHADRETLMRINGDEIETSRGARFPIAHGVRAWRLIKAAKASRRTWKRANAGPRLGHYTLDEVTERGDVRAGCHFILAGEVERMARALNLT